MANVLRFHSLNVRGEAITGWSDENETEECWRVLIEIGALCLAARNAPRAIYWQTQLAERIARLSVQEGDDNYAEVCADGVALSGGNGPEADVIRHFGRLCRAVTECA